MFMKMVKITHSMRTSIARDLGIVLGKHTNGTRSIIHQTARQSHTVTLDNLFSESNKLSVQTKLRTSQPVFKPDQLDPQERRKASVLVPLCLIDGEPSILFMMRSRHLSNHRGEIWYMTWVAWYWLFCIQLKKILTVTTWTLGWPSYIAHFWWN